MKLITENKSSIFLKKDFPESIFLKFNEFETLIEKGGYIKNVLLKIFD